MSSSNGGLPTGWRHATLGELGEYHNGRGFKKSEWSDSGRPIIRIQNLTDSSKPFNHYEGLADPRHEVSSGDILVSWAATLGVFRWTRSDAVLNQHIFKVASSINPDFHFHLLESVIDDLRARAHGSGMIHVTRGRFLETPVALPPPDAQQRIAEMIEQKLSELTMAKSELARAQAKLDDLRAALLARLVTPSPESHSIGELAEVYIGATPKRADASFWDGGIPWVSSGEVAFCRISETRETVTEAGLGNRETRLHPPGTVLIAMIGEGKTRGQAAILDVAAAHNQNSAAIRLDPDRMLPEFLFYALMARYEENRKRGSGSQQAALNKQLVSEIVVPCPSLDEQRAAVRQIEEMETFLRFAGSDLAKARAAAAPLERSLRHRALLGKLT